MALPNRGPLCDCENVADGASGDSARIVSANLQTAQDTMRIAYSSSRIQCGYAAPEPCTDIIKQDPLCN